MQSCKILFETKVEIDISEVERLRTSPFQKYLVCSVSKDNTAMGNAASSFGPTHTHKK